ncbi:MAG: hypothetical protein WKG07_18365 [Hymenobacter sp.]
MGVVLAALPLSVFVAHGRGGARPAGRGEAEPRLPERGSVVIPRGPGGLAFSFFGLAVICAEALPPCSRLAYVPNPPRSCTLGTRWLVLRVFGLVAVYRAYTGAGPAAAPTWGPTTVMGASFVGSHAPAGAAGAAASTSAWVHWGARTPPAQAGGMPATRAEARFFKMEHLAVMLPAAVLAQGGPQPVEAGRHRRRAQTQKGLHVLRPGPAAGAAHDSVGPGIRPGRCFRF